MSAAGRLHRAGHRSQRLHAADAARYRATLAATDDLSTKPPRRCHEARTARRTVRNLLRTATLIGADQ